MRGIDAESRWHLRACAPCFGGQDASAPVQHPSSARCFIPSATGYPIGGFISKLISKNSSSNSTPDSLGPVTGFVRTPDGSPIPGATVRLVNSATNKAWVTWTDESGKFEIPSLPTGPYRVSANQIGFARAFVEAQILPTANKPLALALQVATLAQLQNPAGFGRRSRPGGGQAGAVTGQGSGAGRRYGAGNSGSAAGSQSGAGGRGARGSYGRSQQQLPPGDANAISEGLASGGFAQTDVAGDEASEATGAAGAENTLCNPGLGVQTGTEVCVERLGVGFFPSTGNCGPGSRRRPGGFRSRRSNT